MIGRENLVALEFVGKNTILLEKTKFPSKAWLEPLWENHMHLLAVLKVQDGKRECVEWGEQDGRLQHRLMYPLLFSGRA